MLVQSTHLVSVRPESPTQALIFAATVQSLRIRKGHSQQIEAMADTGRFHILGVDADLSTRKGKWHPFLNIRKL